MRLGSDPERLPSDTEVAPVTLVIMDNWWVNALWSITPTVLIGALFAVVLRFILRADRNERRLFDEMEAKERERRGLPARDER